MNPVLASCNNCICSSCLLHWNGQCPHGSCMDDLRAKEDPFDKAHPGRPPRKSWSNWKTEQGFWCRGGIFYPAESCSEYKQYQNPKVQDCLMANVLVWPDGHIQCSANDTLGCETCYQQFMKDNEDF